MTFKSLLALIRLYWLALDRMNETLMLSTSYHLLRYYMYIDSQIASTILINKIPLRPVKVKSPRPSVHIFCSR